MIETKVWKVQCVRATGRVEVLAWWPSLPADFRQCHHIVTAVITPASQVAMPTHFSVTPSFFFLKYPEIGYWAVLSVFGVSLGTSKVGTGLSWLHMSRAWIYCSLHSWHNPVQSALGFMWPELCSSVFQPSQASAVPLYGLSLSAVQVHKPYMLLKTDLNEIGLG